MFRIFAGLFFPVSWWLRPGARRLTFWKFNPIMNTKLLFGWAALVICLRGVAAEPAQALPQTRPLDWEESDLSSRLMDGAHQFVERQIAEAAGKRGQFWKRDFSSPAAYTQSIEGNRARFQTIIGVVDARLAPRMERFGDDKSPALVAETSKYRVY